MRDRITIAVYIACLATLPVGVILIENSQSHFLATVVGAAPWVLFVAWLVWANRRGR